ncbi:MAG: DUF835 domain-containing protein [Methanomassiliicoccus sp.]|nr:DUF835 domain-containing protein [Methanomassiliicoccus sp.]
MSAREDFYRGYVKGFEEGLNKAWDDLIGLTTKGFSPREIQVMAKSKRQSIGDSVKDRKKEIKEETGIDLITRSSSRQPSVRVDHGNAYLIESMFVTRALAIVNELTSDGTRALCILRSFPGNYQDALNPSVSSVWLTKHESGQFGDFQVLSPSEMGRIVTETRSFMKEAEGRVVLLEGVEYLIVQNDTNGVLKFLQTMLDQAVTLNGILLLTVYPNTLDEHTLSNLKCLTGGTL